MIKIKSNIIKKSHYKCRVPVVIFQISGCSCCFFYISFTEFYCSRTRADFLREYEGYSCLNDTCFALLPGREEEIHSWHSEEGISCKSVSIVSQNLSAFEKSCGKWILFGNYLLLLSVYSAKLWENAFIYMSFVHSFFA